MRLIADKVISGGKYNARPGDEFECPDDEAAGLIEAKAAHPVPAKVERAVETPKVEKAVNEPEVSDRVIPPEKVGDKPKPKPRKRRARKVSGKK